jgi:hypothetical protein
MSDRREAISKIAAELLESFPDAVESPLELLGRLHGAFP